VDSICKGIKTNRQSDLLGNKKTARCVMNYTPRKTPKLLPQKTFKF